MPTYTIPFDSRARITTSADIKRIRSFLQDRGVVVNSIKATPDSLIIDANKNPTADMGEYDTAPTLEERALQAGTNAAKAIRAKPIAQWSDAEKLAMASWVLVTKDLNVED